MCIITGIIAATSATFAGLGTLLGASAGAATSVGALSAVGIDLAIGAAVAGGVASTVGSVQQHRPNPAMPIYSASKCAQMSLVECLSKDLAPTGVTVNNISPGVIATPRNDAVLSDPTFYEKVMQKIPMAIPGQAYDCVGAFLLLASEEGKYITGADIKIDGGMSL